MSSHFDVAKVSDEILVEFCRGFQRFQVPHKVLRVSVLRVVASDDAMAPIFLQCPDEEIDTGFEFVFGFLTTS